MQGSRPRQGTYLHYNKLNKKGYFESNTPTYYLGFSFDYCDLITIYKLEFFKDSNLH